MGRMSLNICGSGEWSGDADLNDGKLQHQYAKYLNTFTIAVQQNFCDIFAS